MSEVAGAGGSRGAKGEVERIELDRNQQSTSRKVAESKATIPHLYLRAAVDMSRAAGRLDEISLDPEGEPSDAKPVPMFADIVVEAVADALRKHPRANGSYRDGGFELYSRVNVGIAVAAGGAITVPTIVDADGKGVAEIAAESRRLEARVRDGEITPPELAGGTFTVFDLGRLGVPGFDPVVIGGQAGTLGIGAVEERPVVRLGELRVAPVMEITLSCDHRILHGVEAAAFLVEIKSNLEQPELLE
jgi:pyruvate dehydrogenase E2 component (dihydrolipoamide acetyltransferase)